MSKPDLWSRYAALPTLPKMVMRLKALVGSPVNKTSFFQVVRATETRAPDGRAWSVTALNPLLDGLAGAGLLDEVLACPPALLHPVTVDAITAAPDLVAIVRNAFPPDNRGSVYRAYTMQDDDNALRQLRLALYGNDDAEFARLLDLYDRDYSLARGPHMLDRWFRGTPVAVDWLAGKAIGIQHAVFQTKFLGFFLSGQADADLPALLEHVRAHRDDPAFTVFVGELLHADIMAGRLAEAADAIAATPFQYDFERDNLAGTVHFLAGRNAEALTAFRQALKTYRKHIGKRKFFFGGTNGAIFLLALLNAKDPALYPEIQAGLDGVDLAGNPYAGAFRAIQALLLLLQGFDAKARDLLDGKGNQAGGEPLSAALLGLARLVVDPDLARKAERDIVASFQATADVFPLIARIHAEVLTRLARDPARYQAYLDESTAGGGIALRFLDIVTVRQPWERAFDHLESFVRAAAPKPAAAPAARKTKRLAWYLDLEHQIVDVAEQSARGADWSSGRNVAMKRLHEQDPRLDYLTDHDRRALRTIRKETTGWYNEVNYYFEPVRTLPALVGHPAVFDARDRSSPLELVSYPAELVVTEQRNGFRFTLSHRAEEPRVFLEQEAPGRWRVIEVGPKLLALQDILGSRGLLVPKEGRERVLDLVRERAPALPIRADIAAAGMEATPGSLTPVLQLQPLEGGLSVTLVMRPFGPDGPAYPPGQGGASILAMIGGRQLRVSRDLDGEHAAATAVVAALPTLVRIGGDGHGWVTGDLEASLDLLLEIRACPHPVTVEWPQGQPLRVAPPLDAGRLSLRIAGSQDWFRLRGEVAVDEDLVLDMQDLLERLDKAQGRYVPLADGRFAALTRQFQRQMEQLRALSEAGKDGRKLHALGAVAVQELLDGAGKVSADQRWRTFQERLRAAEGYEPAMPATLQAELRDYQVEGMAWMARLAHWGAGACLADDMGLGKTVQTIAVMLLQAALGPILVLAPTSVCHNWENELSRFAPTLQVHRLSEASDRAALVDSLRPGHVLVASYGLLPLAVELLAGRTWRMVVFDEAQALKNADTKRAQAAHKLAAEVRVALTGTPIENYLDELWSLFQLINPGLLGARDSFQRRFATPIQRDRNPQAREALRGLIRPFILRRTKSAVLSELPPRTERTIEVELDDAERAFYEALRRKALEAVDAGFEAAPPGQRRIGILAEIGRLRRACCHPALIDPHSPLPGAKREVFLDLVDELRRNHHRALVFSQFVGHLEQVRAALEARGVQYQYLDGSTPARQREQRVAAFQAGEGELFLISLKAGGTGLNLTAADYVIHLDPWWNPAVEDQASDRAHRIGQHRPVTVYRLIVRDSIEEQILRLHRTKRDLASDLLDGADVSGRLSDDELIGMIRGG